VIGGDDLTGLLRPPPDPDSGFRQGTVVAFDPATGANTISVAGGVLTDVPLLNIGDTVNLAVGDVVVLMRLRSSWCVLGKVLTVGSTKFAADAVAFGSIGLSNPNFGLTTTHTPKVSGTVTAPAWANSALILAVADASVANTSAAADFVNMCVTIDGVSGGTPYAAVAPAASGHPTKYGHVAASAVRQTPVTGGATYTISADVWSTVGTWAAATANIVNLNATAIFRKV
jgi:hypothetical protein